MGKMGGVKASKTTKDLDHIQNDIASFASSLGFSTAPSSSSAAGFNDSDFRKTGPLKPHSRPPKNSHRDKAKHPREKDSKDIPRNNSKGINSNPNLNAKSAQIQTPNFSNGNLFKERDNKFKNLPKLPLLKASAMSVWYEDAALLEKKVIGDNKKIEFKSVDEWKGLVEEKKKLGERLLAQYANEYESSRGQSGDIKMLIATQRSGTAADKVSAFSVLVGDNPIANLRSIDMLLGMVTSKVGKRHALTAFEALKELFISSLLPDRKLKTLVQQPLNHLSDTKDGHSLLLFWHWEECLKERYERFVASLEEASQDVLDILRNKALKTMYTLLRSKSEQERRLLSALVNKLGHPENKVASNADYHLANLLADHPNMKGVVIDEVDNFLFRPHLGLRAKYHAVNFLSQIRLSHKGDGPKAAKRLIDIYFALFKVLISEAGKTPPAVKQSEDDKKSSSSLKENKSKSLSESHIAMDSRLLSALLTGVNRAFPFVSGDEADDIVEVQTPMLFQLVHSKNFNVGVQALMLLDKISSKNQIVSDRFYRALYSKLLLPAAICSSKEELFIGLMLRAMKNDVNIKRVAAFSKRLLQVALQLPPQYACGCLFLLSEVLKARPPLWNMVLQNESVDDDLEHFEDVKDDDDKQVSGVPDVKDDKKEVAQTSDDSESDSDSSLGKSGSMTSGSDEDEDDLNQAYGLLGKDGVNELKELKSVSDSTGDDHLHKENDHRTLPGGYNPRHREPSYCNADRVSWWELTVLASHAHPSVSAMAQTLLSGAHIVYSGNPLNDLSLIAFLDKFMEKKPRQSTWHGASQIEPAKKLDMKNQLIGPEIISLAEEDVAPEDLVFHKFYMNKMNSTKKPKKKKKKTADDEAAEEFYAVDGDGDDDESDNEEIERALESANPALELDDDGGYDYDDLDKIVNEDDEDLLGGASDEDGASDEEDFPSDIAVMEIDDGETVSGDEKDEDDVVIGEADDDSDMDEGFSQRKNNLKSNKHSAKSPFASIEDYQHLMDDSNLSKKTSGKKMDHSNSSKKTSSKKRSRKGTKNVK